MAAQVLAVLEPAALELSLAAADDIEQERARLHRNWQQQVERAHYEAERAQRQYDAVEPENRLVARELERRWEEALKEQRRLEEEYARFGRNQPRGPVGVRARANPLPGAGPAGTVARGDDDGSGPPADRPPVGQGGGRHGPRGERTGRRDHPLGRGLPAAATNWCARCSVTSKWPTTSGS